MLKKDVATSWTKECQKALNKVKEYLSKPSVLVPPKLGRPLLLYLSVLDGSFGYILGQHDETGRKEQAIYHLRKKFTPYEARYSLLERSCCALTWIAQKLRHYFCAYTTYIISRMDLLKYIFQKPMPTEYEACILGIRLAIDMDVQELLVIGDSDLLVHQVLGEWATKNTKILPYFYYVQELIKRFTKIEFKHVPRVENEFEDALATLSSMIQHPDKNFIDPILIGLHKQPTYCVHVE
ncbi:uncharacterized protein [Nicotiana sylvestris]|uniref:uncharacterized protein n=1 Tax=Nicotiana sylvestris TaxID=4096 RepID=UPI00388CD083